MTRLLLWLIERAVPPADRESVLGDTVEEFHRRQELGGPASARRWLRGELYRVLLAAPRHRLAARELRRRSQTGQVDRLVTAVAHMLATFTFDLKCAVRQLGRSPSFASVAILSLGLGMGANSAIFSLIDTVLLKTLPVADPQTLFFVDNSGGKSEGNSGPPYPCYELLRDHNRSLSGIAAFDEAEFKVTIDGVAEELRGQYASGSFFDLLGIVPVYGRLFTPADDSIIGAGGPAGGVAVISHAFWHRRFAADPTVLGKTIQVGTRPVTIVGVTPPDFFGLQVGSVPDITIPMMLAENNLRTKTLWWFSVVARLKPGITVEQARADLHTLWDSYMTKIGEPREKRTYFSGIALVPASRGLASLRQQLSEPLLIMMSIVGLVLLIGCANVANLLLARASARRHELSVRFAIGASRGRVIRQLLTEGAALVSFGCLAGLLFARWGVAFLTGFIAASDTGFVLPTRIDLRMLAFTAAVGVLTTLLFSLAPALHATRFGAARPPSVGATSFAEPRIVLRQGLMMIQVMLAVVLLSGAGLFVRTLYNLQALPSGIEPGGVLTMEVQAAIPRPTIDRPTPAEARTYYGRLGAMWTGFSEQVAVMPGVFAAAVATMSPLTGRDRGVLIAVSGGAPLPSEDRSIHVNQVTPGYFDAFRIRLLAGRFFTVRDRANSSRVAILNETAARAYFGVGSPIGARVTFPGQRVAEVYEIIGVVGDIRYESLRLADERMAYLPIEQSFDRISSTMLVVRGTGDVTRFVGPIRAAAVQAVPEGFVTRVATMEDRVEQSLVRERLLSILTMFFGGLALVLGCVGLYGVMTFAVVRRTREIGIRMAIGARQGTVGWMIVRETFVVTIAGIVAGTAASVMLAALIRSQLFGVAPGDPLVTALVLLLLVVVALAAAYVPARRATRIDPLLALRCD
jgi:putative ABC transport system permease protein